MLRVHGQNQRNYHKFIGMAGDGHIQASILLAKLKYFEKELEVRQKIANYYTNALSQKFETPVIER